MKLVLDNILKGIVINKQGEVDYTAIIEIMLDSDVDFYYAVTEDGNETSDSVVFTPMKKSATLKVSNTDGIYRKRILVLKADQRVSANVKINMERMVTVESPIIEELGPVGKVLISGNEETTTPWYKNPWLLGGLVVTIIGVVFIASRYTTRQKKTSYFGE